MSDSLTLQKVIAELYEIGEGDTITREQQLMLYTAASLLLEYKELWTEVNS